MNDDHSHASLLSLDKMNRNAVVTYYVNLILSVGHGGIGNKDVVRINNLIITKWSPSALDYIKAKAWKNVKLSAKKK